MRAGLHDEPGRLESGRDVCGAPERPLRPAAPPYALARGDPSPPLRPLGSLAIAFVFPGGFAPPDPPTRSLAGTPTPHSARVAPSLSLVRVSDSAASSTSTPEARAPGGPVRQRTPSAAPSACSARTPSTRV